MSFFEAHDPVFNTFVFHHAPVKKLADGFDWAEGPVWFGDANCLIFSDVPNNRMYRWVPEVGLSVFRAPSNFSNGNTRDLQGRLITCEHGARRVTRTEHDGTLTVLADSFEGKRLNSPNDVVVKSDGSIWFSDPHYGIASNLEGFKSDEEVPCQVYRLDPETGAMTAVVTDMACPNGLAFSPDESHLYVADTGRVEVVGRTKEMRVYEVDGDQVGNGQHFHTVTPGCSDGFRLDSDGNIWTSAGDGVHCLSPKGELLGKILVPETVSNVCFGGRGKHQLYITATTSLYRVSLNRAGIQTP